MPRYTSTVRTSTKEFRENREYMLGLIQKSYELSSRAAKKSALRKPRFDERGQLLPAQRLTQLLDPGMPFFEIGNLAGYMQDTNNEEETVPGGSIITGVGFINSVRSVVVVDDSGINAGAMTVAGGMRLQRAQRIALEQKLPFIHLVESAGADLPRYRVEGFVIGGRMFANQARLSAAGIPVVTVLHGASTAGGAYMPGMSDYVVAIAERGKAFLAGPALLKAATGEVATEEDLGGAKMHATVTGLAEYLAENDSHGLAITRELLGRLRWNERCPTLPRGNYAEPHCDPDEIAGLVPIDYRQPYEAREVIARIVDGSDFLDFKPGYGVSTVCVQAAICGHQVNIMANNGPIDPNGATKATQFMQLSQQANKPMIFIQNTTGYLVGKEYEQGGMIKHGSKMIQAVTNLTVPRLTVMTGASFGAGNYGMCGQGFDPDFVVTWPNTKTGVMGGAQAAGTMRMVAEMSAERRNTTLDVDALDAQQKALTEHFSKQESAFYTSGLMLDDGVIDPRDTRVILGFLLDTCWEANNRRLSPNTFGIARM